MHQSAVMVSGPIIKNSLAYQLAADLKTGDGFISYKGETDDIPDGLAESTQYNIRDKLPWQPTSRLATKLTINHRKANGNYLNWASIDGDDTEHNGDEEYTISLSERKYHRLQDSFVNSIAADLDYQVIDDLTNSTTVTYNNQSNKFDKYPTGSSFKLEDTAKTLESRLAFKPEDSSFSGLFGIVLAEREAAQHFDVPSISRSADGKTDKTRIGSYGEASIKFHQLTLTAAGRLQYEQQKRFLEINSASAIDQDIDDSYFLPKLCHL